MSDNKKNLTRFVFNGVEYFGNEFKVKEGKLYVDGHLVADYSPAVEYIVIEGEGTIQTTETVVINGSFSGTINAATVVMNDSDVIGTVNAQKIINNK
jgi:uncharacterized protein with beta-barrel porin domain